MTIGPIDYLSAVPQQDFLRDIQGGFQLGAGIRQVQQQQQAQQLAQQQAQQYKVDIAAALANPTPQAFAALAIKYPQQREAVKQAWDGMSEGDRKNESDTMAQAYAALLAGKPDVAKQVVQTQIDARKNSGLDTSHYDNALTLLDTSPKQAQGAIGLVLSHINDPKAFAGQFGALGQEGRAMDTADDVARKTKADADAAVSGADSAKSKAVSDAVDAKYADVSSLAKLEGIRADTEFKRQSTKIAYLNAQIARETNALKRQELGLQVQKATQERDDKAREKVASAESAASATDNMLNTIERVLKNPSLGSVLGSIQGRMPAVLSDESADAIAQIETLGSQAFIAQIPSMKGTGSLSEKEGDKLQASLQNLSRVQSEQQFKANLAEIQRIARKARDNISKRYGVPLGNPDTPAAGGASTLGAAARPPLSSFGG